MDQIWDTFISETRSRALEMILDENETVGSAMATYLRLLLKNGNLDELEDEELDKIDALVRKVRLVCRLIYVPKGIR